MKYEEIIDLMDKAAAMAGSDYKIAKSIGVTPQVVSDWRHQRRNPQPEDIALLAGLAGLNAEQWAMRALIEKHEGTAKGDRLYKALGKALLATGATVASVGANATVISGMMSKVSSMVVPSWAYVSTWWDILVPVGCSTMYIMST
jgi:hypothetical protein